MPEYSVFKTFYAEEEAIDLLNLLNEKGINGIVEKSKILADKIFVGDITQGEIFVKLKEEDFDKANTALNEYISNNLDTISSDYYLHSFTNEELNEIIQKPDEWSNQDVIIARKLLAQRGHALTDTEIKEKATSRLQELMQPESEKPGRVVLGYLFAIVLPIYGLFYGLMMHTAKKLLPNGQRVYAYNKETRSHGLIITAIGATITGLAIIRVFTNALGQQLY